MEQDNGPAHFVFYAGVMHETRHDMPIRATQERRLAMQTTSTKAYRNAITEVQQLADAKEGSAEFARRHQLIAALHQSDQSMQQDACRLGRPALFALREDTPTPKPGS